MFEYIEKVAMIRKARQLFGSEWYTERFVSLVESQSVVDVAPVRRGHWKRDRENRPICSECAEEPYRNGDYNPPNYCPNCGKKMEITNDN